MKNVNVEMLVDSMKKIAQSKIDGVELSEELKEMEEVWVKKVDTSAVFNEEGIMDLMLKEEVLLDEEIMHPENMHPENPYIGQKVVMADYEKEILESYRLFREELAEKRTGLSNKAMAVVRDCQRIEKLYELQAPSCVLNAEIQRLTENFQTAICG